MAEMHTRSATRLQGCGPYLAEVVNNRDPSYQGQLEVVIKRNTGNLVDSSAGTHVVKYMTPFYGAMSVRFEGNNSNSYHDSQKSYGWWAVPPDIGTTVMVIFADNGDTQQGYWMGCIPDEFQNFQIPGFASSDTSDMTPTQLNKYGTNRVPVSEYLKSTKTAKVPNPDTFKKSVSPFADVLMAQGLLVDDVRGRTSSSARRESPSQVFGISTPGPIDPLAPKKSLGQDQKTTGPVSRTGGSSFVMDDGDASGQNELIRLRTRTGHQILLHNSSDLIYISNAGGTAWIELTSDGKIDVWAQDSISCHTENDLNLLAGRDVNIEAVRNINLKATGKIQMETSSNFTLKVSGDGSIQFGASGQLNVGTDLKMTSQTTDILSAGTMNLTGSPINLYSSTNINQQAVSTINSLSGEYILTAGFISQNAITAATSAQATAAATVSNLTTYNLPGVSKAAGWSGGKFYKGADINTIMKRAPTHEPWPQHENVNPAAVNAANTDRGA